MATIPTHTEYRTLLPRTKQRVAPASYEDWLLAVAGLFIRGYWVFHRAPPRPTTVDALSLTTSEYEAMFEDDKLRQEAFATTARYWALGFKLVTLPEHYDVSILEAFGRTCAMMTEIFKNRGLRMVGLTSIALAMEAIAPAPMDLIFAGGLTLTVFLAVLITGQIAGDGRSDWLKGVQLLAVYLLLAVSFFFVPAGA